MIMISACWTCLRPPGPRQRTHDCPPRSANGGTGVGNERRAMAENKQTLTTPDLVILSLLAERAMHGYEVNAELERRQARDWVDISRPQIYYSLEKLRRQRLLAEAESGEPALGA